MRPAVLKVLWHLIKSLHQGSSSPGILTTVSERYRLPPESITLRAGTDGGFWLAFIDLQKRWKNHLKPGPVQCNCRSQGVRAQRGTVGALSPVPPVPPLERGAGSTQSKQQRRRNTSRGFRQLNCNTLLSMPENDDTLLNEWCCLFGHVIFSNPRCYHRLVLAGRRTHSPAIEVVQYTHTRPSLGCLPFSSRNRVLASASPEQEAACH
jgi:hypothetical protein